MNSFNARGLEAILRQKRFGNACGWDRLTCAEREVALQLKQGLSNREIATGLGKSPATVKSQVSSILDKMQVPTRTRLIARLYEKAP